MGIFYEEQPLGGLIYPDTCPYAPILKLLASAKEVGEPEVVFWEPGEQGANDVFEVTFWIRR